MSCDLEVTNESARCWGEIFQLYNNEFHLSVNCISAGALIEGTVQKSNQIESTQLISNRNLVFEERAEMRSARRKPLGPRARFSKVTKLYGPFSGVTIPFVSQERREFNTSNFTVIFSFCYLKNTLKDPSPK